MCEVLIPVAPEVGLCVKALENCWVSKTGGTWRGDFETGLYRCDMRKVSLARCSNPKHRF